MKIKKILGLAAIGASGIAAAPYTGGTSIGAAATWAGLTILHDREDEETKITKTKKERKQERKKIIELHRKVKK